MATQRAEESYLTGRGSEKAPRELTPPQETLLMLWKSYPLKSMRSVHCRYVINPIILIPICQLEFSGIYSQQRPETYVLWRQPVTLRLMHDQNRADVMSSNAIHQDLGIRNRREPYRWMLAVVKHELGFICHDYAVQGLVCTNPLCTFQYRIVELLGYFGLHVTAS